MGGGDTVRGKRPSRGAAAGRNRKGPPVASVPSQPKRPSPPEGTGTALSSWAPRSPDGGRSPWRPKSAPRAWKEAPHPAQCDK